MKPSSAAAGTARGGAEYKVQVLDRAFGILEELASGPAERTGGELSLRLGLHKSTVHRLLVILENRGFIERTPAGRYRLGWHLFELGMIAVSRLDLYERAKPHVARLVEETGETAHVGVLRQGDVVSLVNVESQRSVRTPSTVGRRTPLHCSSQGKAILAHLPDSQVDQMLKHYRFAQRTRNTITTETRFRAELALVARRGYAVDNEEYEEGLRCVGVPVRNHQGDVIAAISIAGPSTRVTRGRIPELSRHVFEAAAEISRALGYRARSRSEEE